ncbi:MAG: hypothetical protein J7M29_09525 [Verrucomicrobia bacterium]|nr:hypothetical protein [Verrucomicrobiota bacterium]
MKRTAHENRGRLFARRGLSAAAGWAVLFSAVGFCLLGGERGAADRAPEPRTFRQWAEREYQAARAAYLSCGGAQYAAAWKHARACFDMGEAARDNRERAVWAEEGVLAGEKAVAAAPNRVEGHYYLALNLGQMARVKQLRGLFLIKRMEAELRKALAADPAFDYAGPDRCLGMLYRDAPGWPLSLGSRKRARRHLESAVRRAPDYFPNRLNLIEALLKWGERTEAKQQFPAARAALAKAKARFRGVPWTFAWPEWLARWEQICKKLGEDVEQAR